VETPNKERADDIEESNNCERAVERKEKRLWQ
jgi:hypothetical protein